VHWFSKVAAPSAACLQVEALSQLMGAAAPSDCMRAPATSATIQGAFVLAPQLAELVDGKLGELGVPASSLSTNNCSRLVLRREVGPADWWHDWIRGR